MLMYSPFDRRSILMYIDDYVRMGYGSYNELIELTVKDLMEIGTAIKSKEQEKQLAESLNY